MCSIREVQILPPVDYPVLGLCRLLRVEWNSSEHHFVQNHSRGPPIARLGVSGSCDDLWSHVVTGSDDGVCVLPTGLVADIQNFYALINCSDFWRQRERIHALMFVLGTVESSVMGPSQSSAQSEISQFDMTVLINQNVIRFYISVNEANGMNVFDSTCQLGYVEPGKWLLKYSLLDQKCHHVASRDILHDKIKTGFILEREEETNDPRGISFSENVSFCFHMGSLLFHNDICLLKTLHRIHLSSVLLLHQRDLSECSDSDVRNDVEVVLAHLLSPQPRVPRLLLLQNPQHLLPHQVRQLCRIHLFFQLSHSLFPFSVLLQKSFHVLFHVEPKHVRFAGLDSSSVLQVRIQKSPVNRRADSFRGRFTRLAVLWRRGLLARFEGDVQVGGFK